MHGTPTGKPEPYLSSSRCRYAANGAGAGLTFDNGSAGCGGPSDYAVTGPVTRNGSGMGGGLGWPPIGLLNSKAFEVGRISTSALRDEQLETFERRCEWALERCETIRPQFLPI